MIHDARGRLTVEERTGSQPYRANYGYDDNGNRTSYYLRVGEIGAPPVRYSFNHSGNRVTSYEKWLGYETLLEEGGYDYDENWNIRRITRTVYAGAEEWFRQTVLKYDEMGRLWRVLEYERLLPDGDSECVAAREFRHASGRQRYLVRQLDPETLEPIPGADVWSDYLDESIHGDYAVAAGGAATELTRYLPGHWQTDVQAASTSFFHTNMLRTTRMFTDDLGQMVPDSARLYTAFGDVVTPPPSATTRYGYAGAWGYEGGPSLWGSSAYAPDFLHVGARYYSPTLGRFLQRDPIGIFGGLNVYAYVENSPLSFVDPNGLMIVLPHIDPRAVRKWLEGPGLAGAIGAGTGAIIGVAKGAVAGAGAGAVAGGVGAGPGAVAGAIACGMIGYIEGWGAGVVGWHIYDAATAPAAPEPIRPAGATPKRPSFWDALKGSLRVRILL